MQQSEPPAPGSPEEIRAATGLLVALVDRLRPGPRPRGMGPEERIRAEIARLAEVPDQAAALGRALLTLLAQPGQTSLYADVGVQSGLGFWMELVQRAGQRLLPLPVDLSRLRDVLRVVFRHRSDHLWVESVSDATWVELLTVLGGARATEGQQGALENVLDSARVLSYRLAGIGLDGELLRAAPELDRADSPLLLQSEALLPLLARLREEAPPLAGAQEARAALTRCAVALQDVRARATEQGASLRLTYLLARMQQIVDRLDALLNLLLSGDRLTESVRLMKHLLSAEQSRDQTAEFLSENVSLVARNVTDYASQRGEHYIADSRAAWWAMARSAAGGGVIIGLMAIVKIRLSLWHLPPLTEGLVFGLNYGLGFCLIHLLHFTVATKQPAMTAASIAATLEGTRRADLGRLTDLVQNVARTQLVAVLGNIGLALPMGALICFLWPLVWGELLAPTEKTLAMLADLNPLSGAAALFAAIAGVGLFLSGLASGYFDNQARYYQLGARLASTPWMRRLGKDRARRAGAALDAHYGPLLGNLLFGMYLGLMGALGTITGLPVDIRHVAFASANLGVAMSDLGLAVGVRALLWAGAGVIAIALVNLFVSFTLALYVAMASRRLGSTQILRLLGLVLRRFLGAPFAFLSPPPRA